MERVIEREWLDTLPADDAGAIGSRRDLRRLNWWMGHGRIMARELSSALNGDRPARIVELGAGDGEFMLDVARRLSRRWPGANVMLVDQQDTVARRTLAQFEGLGWLAEAIRADVFDWLAEESCATAIVSSTCSGMGGKNSSPSPRTSPPPERCNWKKARPHPGPLPRGEGESSAALTQKEHLVSSFDPSQRATAVCDDGPAGDSPPRYIILANLFLHHFAEAPLLEMLRGIARVARVFIALEPRRSRFALAASKQLWAIGCNQVTRHDAPASVRAGFAGKELSRLWPANGDWHLEERQVGWFSHAFIARRRE
jgi:hypothetical protein